MTDKKNGTIEGPTTVRFERVLRGPIDRVWDHLTQPDLMKTWLSTAASIELRLGGRVELTMGGNSDLPESLKAKIVDGDKVGTRINGTVTRFEPGRALAYTWIDDNLKAAHGEESEVSFELSPRGDDVVLVLTHRRVIAKYIPQVLAGWHTILDVLDARVHSVPPPDFFARFQHVLSEYAPT